MKKYIKPELNAEELELNVSMVEVSTGTGGTGTGQQIGSGDDFWG